MLTASLAEWATFINTKADDEVGSLGQSFYCRVMPYGEVAVDAIAFVLGVEHAREVERRLLDIRELCDRFDDHEDYKAKGDAYFKATDLEGSINRRMLFAGRSSRATPDEQGDTQGHRWSRWIDGKDGVARAMTGNPSARWRDVESMFSDGQVDLTLPGRKVAVRIDHLATREANRLK